MYYASGSGFLKGNFIIIKIQYNLTPCVSHSSIRGSICAADRQDNLASVPPTESHAGCIHGTEAEHLRVRWEWTFKVLKQRQQRMHNILNPQGLALLKDMF